LPRIRRTPLRHAQQASRHRAHHWAGAGITQPGQTIVCGDSHTSTHGAFGTLAFGIGTSEVEHVLATQWPRAVGLQDLHIEVKGKRPAGVTAKDIILAIIGKSESAAGTGHVAEYGGEAIRSLSMDAV